MLVDALTKDVATATRRILLVENLSNWLDIESLELGKLENIVIETAQNFWGAKEKLSEKQYDLVLTDLHMFPGDADNKPAHGDKVIAHVLENYPTIQVGILSGSISKKARDRLLNQEYGLLFLTKNDILYRPDFAREKVENFLVHKPHYYARDEGQINELVRCALELGNINPIYVAIDSLQADVHKMLQAVNSLDMPSSVRSRVVDLITPGKLYDEDPDRAYIEFHEYKNQFQIAVKELGDLLKDNPHTIGLYLHMNMALTGMESVLEAVKGTTELSIMQAWNREVGRMRELYPDVKFEIKTGGRNDPSRFYVSQKFRDTLRILLSNAAQAYEGYSGDKPVELSVLLERHELYVKIKNSGKPIPESMTEGILFPEMVKSTKKYGTGFGLQRALEIGSEMSYSLSFEETDATEAKIEFSDFAYRVVPIDTKKSRVLVFDWARRYDYLENCIELRHPVDYMYNDRELECVAADPEWASRYSHLILHITKSGLDIVEKIVKANPNISIMVISAGEDIRQKAEEMFSTQHCKTFYSMPHESRLYKLLSH